MAKYEDMQKGDKWHLARELSGVLDLENRWHEKAIHLFGYGHTKEEVLLGVPEITSEEFESLLLDPFAQRRLAFKQKQCLRKQLEDKEPVTPEEGISFALKKLMRICKSTKSTKERISALRAIADINDKLRRVPKAKTNFVRVDRTKLQKLEAAYEKAEKKGQE